MKMDHCVGNLSVDVTDELGAVPAEFCHADALRKTYGRATRYLLDPTRYMQAQETGRRKAAKILGGDFYQLLRPCLREPLGGAQSSALRSSTGSQASSGG